MKKIWTLLFIIGLFFANTQNLAAQTQTSVRVANTTNGLITVNGTSIGAKSAKEVNLSVKDGIASFETYYYEGPEKKGPVTLTRSIRNNQVVLRNFSPSDASTSRRRSTESDPEPVSTQVPPPSAYTQTGEWWAHVTVSPVNKLEKYSIFVPADPFRGLALKPGQTSEKSITLRTGEILFPVFLAIDDSQDEQSRTGVNYSWALVNKIVTEGQEDFEFLPQDIMEANGGKVIRKNIISKLPFDFIISQGAAQGTVIPANTPQRLELYVGWNIIPIQYKDASGLPTQAILILLVNDLRRPLLARGRNSSDQITVQRDNIVVTNYSR